MTRLGSWHAFTEYHTYERGAGEYVCAGSDVGRPQVEGVLLQRHVELARLVAVRRRGVKHEPRVELHILGKVEIDQLVQFSTVVRHLFQGTFSLAIA